MGVGLEIEEHAVRHSLHISCIVGRSGHRGVNLFFFFFLQQ